MSPYAISNRVLKLESKPKIGVVRHGASKKSPPIDDPNHDPKMELVSTLTDKWSYSTQDANTMSWHAFVVGGEVARGDRGQSD
jgi:hypothetical protein